MKFKKLGKDISPILAFALASISAQANPENVHGFSAKQSEVVIKAFDILTAQNWDQLTDENLVTLSQAAAIAMDTKNEHYNPKAAFTFMTKILEVQYDYNPLNELTQKVFKSAILSVMRGDYRFSSENERVLRNVYEFYGDLRQMREMLKKAKVVEQRKANECLFVNTLSGLIASTGKEHLERFKQGKACFDANDANPWCDHAYNSRDYCRQGLQKFAGGECQKAGTSILQAVLNPPPCANPVDIAAKVNSDAPYISVEQIEKTLNNEDTELAFNMGLAVTNPATQRTYHIIRDGFASGMQQPQQQPIVEDEEFDLDGPSVQQVIKVLAIEAKSKVQQIADFSAAMQGARYKTIDDARTGKAVLMLGDGTSASHRPEESETGAKTESTPTEPAPAPGFWSRVLKAFGM